MSDSLEYQIQRVGDTWVLTAGDIAIRASDTAKKRNGAITALLTIDSGVSNLFTDSVKLTDLAARKRVVKTLHPHGVPITEPMLRALEAAIRQNGHGAAGALGHDPAAAGKRKAFILDEAPSLVDRPLSIVDGRAYAAAWVHLDSGEESVLVVVRDDGTLFCDVEIDGAVPLADLGITVRLPNGLHQRHCWSGRAINEYRTGARPNPADVFTRMVTLVGHHVTFVRSLGDQQAMCELLACYLLHTWFLDAFNVAGYLWFGGEKGSGKSTALKIACQLGFSGQELTLGSSLPALRDLSDYGALLGLDDAEQVADPKAFDGDKQALLLSGNKRGATITVKEPAPNGKGWVMRHVKIFSPRVFSAIGAPPGALATRCIQIPMCKASANVPDPMDEAMWPEKRRDVIDDLWALGLSAIRQVQRRDRDLVHGYTALVGRELEPWRGVLAIALWLEKDCGVSNLLERMTTLSQSYQREREEFEAEDPTRLAVRCLGDMLDEHTDAGPLVFKTAELADRMNTVGKELDVIEDGREIKTIRVGRLLSRLRLKKPPNRPGKRRWMITRPLFESLAVVHGVTDHLTDGALPPVALPVLAGDGQEF